MKTKLLIIVSIISWTFISGYSQDINKKMTEAEELFERLNRAADGEINSSSTSGAYGRIEYITEEQRNAEALEASKKNNMKAAIILISVVMVLILIIFFGNKIKRSRNKRSVNQKNDNNSLKGAFIPSKLIIRTDGYYFASFKDSSNHPLFIFMFFTSKGFVAYQELEEFDDSDLTQEDYQKILADGEALNDIEVSPQLTKFSKRGEDITMKFYDPIDSSNVDPIEKVPYDDPVIYNKWSGKIIPNGLLLNLELSRFSHALKDYEKLHLIQNLKFEFIPIGMN